MSKELIKAVYIKLDGIYLYSKSNDDNAYRNRKSADLTEAYRNEGQPGLDREIVRMLFESAEIAGQHTSIVRYQPCLLARAYFVVDFSNKINAEYNKLTPEDISTMHLTEDEQTTEAKAYMAVKRNIENEYYTKLAQYATPITNNKKNAKKKGVSYGNKNQS